MAFNRRYISAYVFCFLLCPIFIAGPVSLVKAGQISTGPSADAGMFPAGSLQNGKSSLSLRGNDLENNSGADRTFSSRFNLFSPGRVILSSNQSKSQSGGTGLNLGTVHKYCGIATILAAGTAALSSSDLSLHHASAYTAAGLALVTCLTGFIEYGDMFQLDAGLFSKYNLHIILGTLGTVGCVTAVALADSDEESGHGGFGSAGTACMLVGFAVVKW